MYGNWRQSRLVFVIFLIQIILFSFSLCVQHHHRSTYSSLHGLHPLVSTAFALGGVLVSFAEESPSNASISKLNDTPDNYSASKSTGLPKKRRASRRPQGARSPSKRRGVGGRNRPVTASDIDAVVDLEALRGLQLLQERSEDPRYEKEEYETSPRIEDRNNASTSTPQEGGRHYQKRHSPVDNDYLTASSYKLRQHHSGGRDGLSQPQRAALFSASSGATNSNGEEDQSVPEDTASAVVTGVNSISPVSAKQPPMNGAPATRGSTPLASVPAGSDGNTEKPAVADVSDVRSLPPRVRLCDVPPVFFPRPSRELAELAAMQVAPERAEERVSSL